MTQIDDYQPETHEFVLRKEIKEKQARLLSFLYNVQNKIAAEKFDQKFAPFSELKTIQKNETINGEEVKRIFAALSEKLHQRILKEDIECDRSLNKLETLWETMKIQPFHRYYFQKYLFSTYVQNMHTLIKHQDLLIRKEQHIYFSILRAIWAREACLNHISRQLKQTNPEDMYEHFNTIKERSLQKKRKTQQKQYRVHGYRALYRLDQQEVNLGRTKMEDFFEDINNYRKLTVHVIQLIINWKEYICSLTHDPKKRKERIQYYYESKNYLLNLLNDSKFISQSVLSNFFTFSVRNDPLLFRPILALQKTEESSQLSFQESQLKILIQIKPLQLHKMMNIIEYLHNQLETNLRNRKVISTRVLQKVKSMSLEQVSFIKEELNSPIKRIKLSPLLSQRSQSLKTSKLGSKQVSQISLAKSNVLIRKTSQISKSTKTFFGNPINPERVDPFRMMQSQKLRFIKEEVFKKVKEELEYETKKSLLKSKQFEELIDLQVKKNWEQLLENERKQIKEAVFEVTPISFTEQQIGSYLTYLYKYIPPTQYELQRSQKQLSNILSDIEYCNFLKITSGNAQISHIISRINRQINDYKVIEILLIAYKDITILQKIILRTIQFYMKYQNAKQIIFNFSYQTPDNQRLMKDLKQKLSSFSTVVEKKVKNHHEIHFIFVKKGKNEKYVFNPYPEKLHFKLYGVLTTEGVKFDGLCQDSQDCLYYQYILMEMLKKFTNSQDFLVLRDTFRPKNRFRYLLTLLMELENHKQDQISTTTLSALSIADLKNQLSLLKKPHLQLSDLLSINNIKMLMLQMTLSPAYSMKVLSSRSGQKMHRYHLCQEIDSFSNQQGTEFLMLEVQQSHILRIVVFDATKYLEQKKNHLYEYLNKIIEKRTLHKRYIDNLWIEMSRHPQTPTQHSSVILHTHNSKEFSSINKELFIGDTFDWFTEIQLQNGLSFPPVPHDLTITRPMGVGVMTLTGCLLYCRILTDC